MVFADAIELSSSVVMAPLVPSLLHCIREGFLADAASPPWRASRGFGVYDISAD